MDNVLYGVESEEAISTQKVIGEIEIKEAAETLAEYKRGKANLENRITEDEMWWKLRHWDVIRAGQRPENRASQPEPASAWLFNSITNKHADAMDNFPEPIVLPRELSDQESAKMLSSVLPVIMEYNDFEQTYNDNWWDKLKHGTAAYMVSWDSQKDNGLGDIDIKALDILKIFYEPGITDIQKSRNLFIVDLVDTDVLDEQYPEFAGKMGGQSVDVKNYIYDDTIDLSDKSAVVDWYYKVQRGGRTILHYAKFVNDCLLYASENDPDYYDRGYYDHGLYPVVFDTLFPEKGTPIGFGYVSICKNPQLYIDQLSANILESSMMGTKKRFFASESTNINEDEFLDWQQPIVHVSGELTDARVKEIEVSPLSPVYLNIMQMKIDEMKDTASNRDINSGGTGSGVTSGAAIAALQEAGNKGSRDIISASYRAYTSIVKMCIELIRQFYDEMRSFRITSPLGEYSFVQFNNAGIKDQQTGIDSFGNPMYRQPIFDLKIKAMKQNPFSRMEQNENAKALYQMGFFSPDRAQEASVALDMMDFEGIEDVREKIKQGATLLNICQQLQMENNMLKASMGMMIPQNNSVSGYNLAPQGTYVPAKSDVSASVMESRVPKTGYMQALAERSVANSDNKSDAANPVA